MSLSAPHIRTGDLRHRAELQKKEQTSDGAGGWTTTWVKDRDLWCRIRPISGSQQLENMRAETTVSHEIYARYATDLTKNKRIVYRGRAFLIEAAWTPEERREFIHMVATEGAAT